MSTPTLSHYYVPERQLGKGAYGEVWLCTHAPSGKRVAVKILHEAVAIRVATIEVEAMRAHLGNPNILQHIESVQEDERLYLVTEFAEGGDLLKFMQERGCRPLSEEQACRYFRQLVFGLDAIHRSGWVHRDLKCENVLLSAARDRVVIADFGFAARWSPDSVLRESFGSIHYSSPEIVTAQPYVGPEVDVWSLGVVLYAMCFGRLPFGGPTEEEIAERITLGVYPIPPTASPALRSLLAMMLHPRVSQRASIEAVKRSTWLISSAAATSLPPLVPRTGSTLGHQSPIVTRPRRSSTSSAEGLFRRIIPQAKLLLPSDKGSAESTVNEQTQEAQEEGSKPKAEATSDESGVLTRLSRFTVNGVKRFSLGRLLKRQSAATAASRAPSESPYPEDGLRNL